MCQTMPVNVSEMLTNTYGNHLYNKQYMLILKRTQIAAGIELLIMTFVEHEFSKPLTKTRISNFYLCHGFLDIYRLLTLTIRPKIQSRTVYKRFYVAELKYGTELLIKTNYVQEE